MKPLHSRLYLVVIISLLVISLSGCKSTPAAVETPVPVDENITEEPASPTNTPRPVLAQPTATTQPTQVPDTPTPTPEPTATPVEVSVDEPTATATSEVLVTPTVQATPAAVGQPILKSPQIIATNALNIVPVADPGPPISVEISANHLLEGFRYRISGTLTNESNENYTGLSVIATFFLESGNRYGPVQAYVKCLFLAPGATCPFVVEAVSKYVNDVILHVSGHPTPRTALAPEYWGVSYSIDRIGYVHITGTVHNQYSVPARHLTIVGSLVNAQGEIVNVNSTILLETLAPEGTAPFEVTIKYVPFRSISIVTQAEP